MNQLEKYLILQKSLENLKEEILCSEISNDSYYLSPAHRFHQEKIWQIQKDMETLKKQHLLTKKIF